ncbi:MAG TPA: dihydrolipoyl dehydrogenase [Candidatus Lustribacter sp.]|nr:dihydrolipoyl dehydrogenase [Candidatus Lustribacter sp.]
MNHQFDLVVVGAGSGGYAAARTARDLGASVALVDHGPLGGLCILRGCMPSKTLIATSDAAHEVRHAHELGVHASEPTVDLDAVMARKREIIQGFTDYRVAGIETFPVFHGEASFESPHKLRVGDDVLEGKTFVIATGSIIMPPVFPGLAETGYIESDEALELEALPQSMIVLGGGYVGCELGQFYARIGVPTTIVIRSGQLLTDEDTDIGEGLTEYFREEGIAVETHARVLRVGRGNDGRKVVDYVVDGVEKSLAAHEIFYALGRVPAVAGLNLEAAGVKYHAMTGIAIDDTLRTSQQHIFAVGDVTGRFALVHVAIQQGELAARNAVHDKQERVDYSLSKTHTVFSDPQVAVAGETEKDLQRAGTPYLVASYPFNDHGKAISIGKTKGFVKMMAAPADGRILGAAILGPEGSDLIHELIVALYYHATVFDFVKIPHLHPTLAEIWTYPAEELVEKIVAARPLAIAR